MGGTLSRTLSLSTLSLTDQNWLALSWPQRAHVRLRAAPSQVGSAVLQVGIFSLPGLCLSAEIHVFKSNVPPPSWRAVTVAASLVTLFGVAELAFQPVTRGPLAAALLLGIAVVLCTRLSPVVAALCGACALTGFASVAAVPTVTPITCLAVLALAGSTGQLRALLPVGAITFVGVILGLILDVKPDGSNRAQNVVLFSFVGGASFYLRRMNDRRVELMDARHQLAAAEARASMARDLHDVTTYSLMTVLTRLRVAKQRLGSRDAINGLMAVDEAEHAAKEALKDLRGLTLLVASGEQTLGQFRTVSQLAEGLEQMVARTPGAQIQCEKSHHHVPANVATTAFRLAQQCLANAASHAQGHPVKLSMQIVQGRLVLRAENVLSDGQPSPGLGMGLQIMRERVAEAGGHFEAQTERGFFKVHCTLPLKGTVDAFGGDGRSTTGS